MCSVCVFVRGLSNVFARCVYHLWCGVVWFVVVVLVCVYVCGCLRCVCVLFASYIVMLCGVCDICVCLFVCVCFECVCVVCLRVIL